MKLAIKGHSTRGKEVIQILENLGGINNACLWGNGTLCYYYIDKDNVIRCDSSKKHKFYTLEEFEKEFPFKVGDIIQTKPYGVPAEIIGLYLNPVSIITYKVRYASGVEGWHSSYGIKLYKEMKEERNITLTLDKAKEWYKKGGELKEIALQAFTEKELNSLPKTWEEFCANYPIQIEEAIIDKETSQIRCYYGMGARDLVKDKNVCPSKKSAEAHLATIQLEQLRDCWRQGWEPDWDNLHQTKYCIGRCRGKVKIYTLFETSDFLCFPTEEMAKEFFECFRDLIEKAGGLI